MLSTLELEKVGGKEIFKPVRPSLWNLDFSLAPLSFRFKGFFFSPSKCVYTEKIYVIFSGGGSNDYTYNSNYYHYHCKTEEGPLLVFFSWVGGNGNLT